MLDYDGLAAALMNKGNLANDKRLRMLETYRREIATLMIGLRRAEVVGQNDRPLTAAETCDLCEAIVEEVGFYVDGRIAGSNSWANMCLPCFLKEGKGIGWGVGQLYGRDEVDWQCIAGGPPEPPEDDDEGSM